MANGISIKNAQHLTTLNNDVEIPVSDGSDEARKINIGDIKSYIGSGLTDDERTALNELMEQKNPLTISATGGGTYEIGSSIAASGSFSVKKGSTDVTSAATITISNGGTISGTTWNGGTVTTDKSWTITATYNGKSVSVTKSVSFLPYIYYGEVSSNAVSESIIKGLTKEKSNATTKGATNLAAGKYYIFAVKGSVNLVCRHNSTEGMISATTGTISIQRVNNTGTDTYSYIVVPASEMAWTFKITNS